MDHLVSRVLSAAGVRFSDHPAPAERFRCPCEHPTAGL